MPFLLAVLPYLLIEALAFWAVATWLGVGFALLLVFGLMVLGVLAAGFEIRRVNRAALANRVTVGRVAADYGLLSLGAILAVIPGLVSSAFGLILIFPPTRALARTILAVKLIKSIEDLGVRTFEMTNAQRPQANYGSFQGGDAEAWDPMVIDEDELQEWTQRIRPEDFTGDDKPGEKQ
ncbi:FxsA family protein [Corynebacterium alimapuense]|uniref:Membrane protein FxsA n=1 Tax=Corynebacterium alimapuense TaxID=1576874 RepID=A0A3M8K9K4_9CORY|nr:FxsA family protein [Corynebacterium alimapuense]RNE49138.1 membrane protein FxsA [Corynebacterium alimapuense]